MTKTVEIYLHPHHFSRCKTHKEYDAHLESLGNQLDSFYFSLNIRTTRELAVAANGELIFRYTLHGPINPNRGGMA